jgi:hypothetical protein
MTDTSRMRARAQGSLRAYNARRFRGAADDGGTDVAVDGEF